MSDEEDREALLARIAQISDASYAAETTDQLRWIAETLERGARVTAQKGRLAALWGAEVDGTDDPPTDGRQRLD